MKAYSDELRISVPEEELSNLN